MGTLAPGNRSLTVPSELSVNRLPSSLKTTSTLLVWRMQLMRTLGSPTRIGPDQEPATFGSAVHLRRMQLAMSAAQTSVATTSSRLARKSAGSAHAVQVLVGVRSHSAPVDVAT